MIICWVLVEDTSRHSFKMSELRCRTELPDRGNLANSRLLHDHRDVDSPTKSIFSTLALRLLSINYKKSYVLLFYSLWSNLQLEGASKSVPRKHLQAGQLARSTSHRVLYPSLRYCSFDSLNSLHSRENSSWEYIVCEMQRNFGPVSICEVIWMHRSRTMVSFKRMRCLRRMSV